MSEPLLKELESTAVVRFQDCDPFQHLNNARYIDYILNARDDQLVRFYNFNIFEHGKIANASWVVTKHQIAYLHPATVMEEVIINTWLVQMTETTLVIEGIMFDKNVKRPKAVAWMEFTYISLATGRTAKHPDDLMQFFSAVCVEDHYQADGFNQRVETVKSQYLKPRLSHAASQVEARTH
ncbi:MAG: acyl-CoA thioesterase [Aggregatilineales bacterium]